jgi:hypothetical protein
LVAIKRDFLWQPALAFERSAEEGFGGCDIPLGTGQKIDSPSFFVDSTIKISPAAFDLHVGFIDAPGPPRRACEAVPALFELRDVALIPRMIVVCANEIPRSAIISMRSRKLSLNLRYQRTQRMMISRSKWRPLK